MVCMFVLMLGRMSFSFCSPGLSAAYSRVKRRFPCRVSRIARGNRGRIVRVIRMVGGKVLDGFAKSMDAFEKASDGLGESIGCPNSLSARSCVWC